MTSMADDLAETWIKVEEGLRLHQYLDTRGNATIGYGRNLSVEGISIDEAQLMLDNDLKKVRSLVPKLPWYAGLTTVRQAIIQDMAYNMGMEGTLAFHDMIQAIEQQDWNEASKQILDSESAKEEPARCAKWAALMAKGEL
jgi:lysozyme